MLWAFMELTIGEGTEEGTSTADGGSKYPSGACRE